MRFLVIDGSSMLVTNYHGTLPRELMYEKDDEKKKQLYSKIMHTSDGVYTNAIYSTLKMILKIIKEQKPEYMAVVFDKTRNTFRRELYAGYKGNRSETPAPLKQQFINMEKLLEDIGIATLYSDQYEADDLAGSVIRKFEGPSMPMAFMTKDQDYLQLISSYTCGWMVQKDQNKADELFQKYSAIYVSESKPFGLPNKVAEFTAETVYGEYGVWPEQIVDKKAIEGDTADNIPGVVGVRTAAVPLLKEYETIEGIYEAIDHEPQKELVQFWKENLGISRSPYNALVKGRDLGMLSKTLATIKTDIAVPDNIEFYRCNINHEQLKSNLKRYEFKSLQ